MLPRPAHRAVQSLAGALAIAAVAAPAATAMPIDPGPAQQAPAAQPPAAHSFVLADRPAPASFVLADRQPVASAPSTAPKAGVDFSLGSAAAGAGLVALLSLGTAAAYLPRRRATA